MASNTVVVEMVTKDGSKTHKSIPISYEKTHTTDKKLKMTTITRKSNKSNQSMTSIENEKVQRKEQLRNKQILYSAKRGYTVLLLITVLLLVVLSIYVIKIDSISYYLLNGITGCMISLLLMIPTFALYRFLEKKVISQHDTINDKIIENFSLKRQLEMKHNQTLLQQQEIKKLELIVAEQEQKLIKFSEDTAGAGVHINMKKYNFQLIHGFRKGQMEIQIEYAQIDELVAMFNVVVACITLLPFGQTNYRKKLKKILEKKIDQNKYLKMHFYFFLLSYVECADVKRLFRKHRIMKRVKPLADHYNYNEAHFDDGMTVLSDNASIFSDRSAPFTPYSPLKGQNILENGQFPDMNNFEKHGQENDEYIIYFKEKDPIKLFRAPIDNNAKPGTVIIVPIELQNRFFDPINGNKFLQQLFVRHIFHSNAKPMLIDCYVKATPQNVSSNEEELERKYTEYDKIEQYEYPKMQLDEMILSSSFILKQGDDLRKDQAILQMFKFMNDIWKENKLRYKKGKYFVEALIYKCIPMGNDVGIIEMISNCIELNKVNTLTKSFIGNITERDEYLARERYNRFMTTAVAAYISSFVCGVRDRHHDNVLINMETCTLFHIDFGYIFNDKTALDTAKFAITSDLKRLFNVYKNGWNDFIDLATNAYNILRQNSTELIDFARVAFAFLYKSNDIEQFIRDSLKLDLTQEQALKYIWNQLTKAPKQWRTKMKNLAHTFAQKMKKKNTKNKSKNSNLNLSREPSPNHRNETNNSLNAGNHTPTVSMEMSHSNVNSGMQLPPIITPKSYDHTPKHNNNDNLSSIKDKILYHQNNSTRYNQNKKHTYAGSDGLNNINKRDSSTNIIVSPPQNRTKTLSLILQ